MNIGVNDLRGIVQVCCGHQIVDAIMHMRYTQYSVHSLFVSHFDESFGGASTFEYLHLFETSTICVSFHWMAVFILLLYIQYLYNCKVHCFIRLYLPLTGRIVQYINKNQ